MPEPDPAPQDRSKRLNDAVGLLGLALFRSWGPDRSALLDCQERLRMAASSDLVLHEAQRHEQIEEAFRRAARDYLAGATRSALAGRLRDMGRFLLGRGRAEEAEQAWVDTVINSARMGREFLESCTPGYYNNEGGSLEGGGFLGENYGGGPIEYHDLIRKWRSDGELKGLKLT